MKTPLPRPTDTELSILRILWEHGPASVREVTERLAEERGEAVGYTTALKLLQIMHGKGLVVRDESERSHRYSALHPPDQVRSQVLDAVADKLFGGAASRLALHALSSQAPSPDEIRQIRALLDELESEEQKGTPAP